MLQSPGALTQSLGGAQATQKAVHMRKKPETEVVGVRVSSSHHEALIQSPRGAQATQKIVRNRNQKSIVLMVTGFDVRVSSSRQRALQRLGLAPITRGR